VQKQPPASISDPRAAHPVFRLGRARRGRNVPHRRTTRAFDGESSCVPTQFPRKRQENTRPAAILHRRTRREFVALAISSSFFHERNSRLDLTEIAVLEAGVAVLLLFW